MFAVEQFGLHGGSGRPEPPPSAADGAEELPRPQAVQPQTQNHGHRYHVGPFSLSATPLLAIKTCWII